MRSTSSSRRARCATSGSSNLTGWQLADAAHLAGAGGTTPFISAQSEYSWLNRSVEAEVLPACAHFGLGFLPYFPLAMGLLTGKVTRANGIPEQTRLAERQHYVTDARLDTVEALDAWAVAHDRSLLDVAIGGLATKPGVSSVIAGATKPEQVHANVAAGRWQPTADELAELDALTA